MFSYVVTAVNCIYICTFRDMEHVGVLRLEFKALTQNTWFFSYLVLVFLFIFTFIAKKHIITTTTTTTLIIIIVLKRIILGQYNKTIKILKYYSITVLLLFLLLFKIFNSVVYSSYWYFWHPGVVIYHSVQFCEIWSMMNQSMY